jgi:hypothetical protein
VFDLSPAILRHALELTLHLFDRRQQSWYENSTDSAASSDKTRERFSFAAIARVQLFGDVSLLKKERDGKSELEKAERINCWSYETTDYDPLNPIIFSAQFDL